MQQKFLNPGISFLRIIMCVGVVAQHFGHGLLAFNTAVPVFMTLVFVCSSIPDNVEGLAKRMKRCLLPFWFWGIAGLVVWPIVTTIEWDWRILAKRFLAQMLLGSSLNSPLYFIFIMLCFTVFFFAIFKVLRGKNGIWFITCCLFIAFFMQYSGINYSFFSRCPQGSGYVLGRIFELMPYAIAGILLRPFVSCTGNKFYHSYAWVGGKLFLLWLFAALMGEALGFGYQGCDLFAKSIVITIIGIELGKMVQGDSSWLNMINGIAKFTPGIYYSHRLVGDLFMKFVMPEVSISGWQLTAFVFIFSMSIVFLVLRCKWLRACVS